MTRIGILLASLVVTISFGSAANAQFSRWRNPDVKVAVNHPPDLNLKVDTVLFTPASGECAEAITERLESHLVEQGFDVLREERLESMLAENNLATSTLLAPATAVKLGRMVGPSALVALRQRRCSDHQTTSSKRTKQGEDTVITYYAKTRFEASVSVQVTDLSTGRALKAETFAYESELQNQSKDGYPENPAPSRVMNRAVAQAVTPLSRLLVPWTETRKLLFVDNGKCGMKTAYQALKEGFQDRAFDLSLQALEACRNNPKIKPKMLGAAQYNLGVVHRIRQDFDAALEMLEQARRTKPGKIVDKAISEVERARKIDQKMQRFLEADPAPPVVQEFEPQAEAPPKAADTLTNADVVRMVESEFSEALILMKIKTSKTGFDLGTDALIGLKKAGVSETVILAMMEAEAASK